MSDISFARDSVLELLIPEDQELDIEESLHSAAEADSEADQGSTLWSSIPQRDLLYFDEHVPLFLLLKAPYEDESHLRNQISRLSIAIEAHAISSPVPATPSGQVASPPASAQPSRDTVWSTNLNTAEEPVSIMTGSDDDGDASKEIILIWKVSAILNRPRIRLQAPAVTFKLSGSLNPSPSAGGSGSSDVLLPPGVPLPANVLEPLRYDPAFQGRPAPHFSAARLGYSSTSHSGSPVDSGPPAALPLKAAPRRPVRAIPALSSRVRFHRTPRARPGRPEMTAALDLDVPAFAPHPIEITDVELDLEDGAATSITRVGVLDLPMQLHARDHTVFIYRLSLDPAVSQGEGRLHRVLDVRIRATIQLSDSCRPRIDVHWRTHVDFTHVLAHHSVPSALVGHGTGKTLDSAPMINGQDGASGSNGPSVALNIAITTRGSGPLYVGEPFYWDVFAINRSQKSRRLHFSTVPKRTLAESKRPVSRPGSATTSTFGPIGAASTAPAAVDDNVLYATLKAHAVGAAELVCLSADAQVGPLEPGQCAETELKLLPFVPGYLQLEAVRVADQDTGEAIDIRELPDVLVLDRNRPAADLGPGVPT